MSKRTFNRPPPGRTIRHAVTHAMDKPVSAAQRPSAGKAPPRPSDYDRLMRGEAAKPHPAQTSYRTPKR